MAKKLYKNRLRITSAQDVRRYLVRVASRLDEGEITTDEARCFGYLAGKMLDSLKAGELEQRIEALEEAAERQDNGEVVNQWA